MSGLGAAAIIEYALAGAGLLLTWLTGRGGYVGAKGSFAMSWSPPALIMGGLFLAFVWSQFGLIGGISIAGSVMWHEWGHVIAYRIAGHPDARFRLIPLFGGVAISNRLPANQVTSCFISLMGPGFSLSLAVLLLLASDSLYLTNVALSDDLQLAALFCAALNALNMMPLWPLDGGRAAALIATSLKPGSGQIVATAGCVLLAGIALINQMWILLIFAAISFASSRGPGAATLRLRPMTPRQAVLSMVAYAAILGAHLMIGLPLLRWFLRL